MREGTAQRRAGLASLAMSPVTAISTFLFVLGVYSILAWVVLPSHVFFAGDSGVKFVQVQALVRQGWRTAALEYPGRELDPALQFWPLPDFCFVRGEQAYSHYPLTFAALSSFFYALLGYGGLYLLPLLSTLLVAFIVYRWVARYAPAWRVVSVLLLCFATPLFFYSLVFWEHTLTVLLSTTGVYLLSRYESVPSRWRMVAAGAALGLACWLREDAYLFALVVVGAWTAVFVLHLGAKAAVPGEHPTDAKLLVEGQRSTWKRSIVALQWLGVGLLAALIPLWTWQQVLYGNSLGPHLGWHVAGGGRLSGTLQDVISGIIEISYVTLVEGYPDRNVAAFLAVAFDLVVLVLWLPHLRKRSWLVLLSGTLLLLVSLPALLYARERIVRGLLAVSPIAVFAVLPLGRLQDRETSRLTAFFLVIILGYIAAVCVADQVDPGLQWGPRMLLFLYPLLVVAALNSLAALERSPPRQAIRVLFAALAAVSVLLQIAGVRLLYRAKQGNLQLVERAENWLVMHIVTEVWWYPQQTASLFYDRQFFHVEQQDDMAELIGRFCQAGVQSFAWVPWEEPWGKPLVRPEITLENCVVRQRSEWIYDLLPRGTVP